jgi:uncharacterized protein
MITETSHHQTRDALARPSGPGGFIRRHPLACYFVLAYGISWVAWTPFILSGHGVGEENFPFPNGPLGQLAIIPGAYLGPLFSAFLVTAIADGRTGLQHWWRRLVRFRVGWYWYALALLGPPVFIELGTLPLPGALAGIHGVPPQVALAYLPALVIQILTTAGATSPCPAFQRLHGPLVGTLILGPLWAGWHLPLFLTDWAPVRENLVAVGEFTLAAVAFSIIVTWVFNRTRFSLPIAILIHAGNNAIFSVAWPGLFPTLDPSWNTLHAFTITYCVLAVLLIAITRGRLGYRPGLE